MYDFPRARRLFLIQKSDLEALLQIFSRGSCLIISVTTEPFGFCSKYQVHIDFGKSPFRELSVSSFLVLPDPMLLLQNRHLIVVFFFAVTLYLFCPQCSALSEIAIHVQLFHRFSLLLDFLRHHITLHCMSGPSLSGLLLDNFRLYRSFHLAAAFSRFLTSSRICLSELCLIVFVRKFIDFAATSTSRRSSALSLPYTVTFFLNSIFDSACTCLHFAHPLHLFFQGTCSSLSLIVAFSHLLHSFTSLWMQTLVVP